MTDVEENERPAGSSKKDNVNEPVAAYVYEAGAKWQEVA